MKKLLLATCALGAAAIASSASEPFYLQNAYVTGFSPDKKIAVSEMFGEVVIYDLESGEEPLTFEPTEDGIKYYAAGVGNYAGNNAICISQGETFSASAFLYGATGVVNGRFYQISNDMVAGMGAANGVTADGTRFCGNNPTGVEFGIDAVGTMIYPCIWDRVKNTFNRTVLPCPEVDYAGLAPQYVTALSISDDGKTVIGQLVSNNGFLVEFIVYTQAEDGTWSYTKPFDHLVNPNKYELPEYPGDGPAQVLPNEFMSEEDYNKYLEDLSEYYANPTEGVEAPKATDYMTEEELAAYTEALQPYLDWLAKYDAWEAIDTKIRQESISFEFNLNALSPNGRYMASSTATTKFVGLTRVQTYQPFVYDIIEKRVIVNGGPNIRVTAVSDNGDVLGYTRDLYTGYDYGYVLPAGASEWVPLEQYVVSRKPSLAQWVEDNWKHEVEVVVDPDEYITEFQTQYITGLPFISRDFSMLSTVTYVTWANDNPDVMSDWYNTCIIDLSDESGIEEIESTQKQNAPVEYFNLQGVRVNEPRNGVFIRRQGSEVSKIRK